MFKFSIVKSIAIASLLVFSTGISQAAQDKDYGITVEPYAGYYQGSIKGTNVANSDIKSYGAGARVGYNAELGVSFGLEYSQSKGKAEPLDGSAKLDVVSKDIGAYIGYGLTERIKLHAAYIPQFDGDFTDENDVVTTFEGDGYNVGISIKLLSFLKFNIEHQVRNLKKLGGITPPTADDKSEITFVSARFPVNFPYKLFGR